MASAAHELVAVAVPFQVYVLTGSSLAVGLVGAAELVPLLLGSSRPGRSRRARPAQADSHRAGRGGGVRRGAALLASAGSPPLVAIYVLAAVIAAFASIEAPVRNASIPQLVGAHYLPPPWRSTRSSARSRRSAGPALAGVLLASLGVTAVYVTAVAGFAVALLRSSGCGRCHRRPGATRSGGPQSGRACVRPLDAGAALDVRDRPERHDLRDAAGALPALAVSTYHVGPGGLGLMYAAPGAGALLGAAASGWVGGVRRQGLAVIVSVVSWGAAIVAFGLVPPDRFPLALILLAAAGWADVISAVFRNTILQLVAPDEMRGRLSALHIAVVTSGPRLGDVEAGAVAAATSVRFAVVSGGLACIAGVGVLHAVSPVLARYRRDDPGYRYLRRVRPPPRAYPAGANPARYFASRPGWSPRSSASSILRTASLTTRPPR